MQLQQVIDSFIIFSAQNTDNRSISDGSYVPELKFSDMVSLQKFPSMLYVPSNIRLVPFPTRDYTDDEFQSIIKKVMGVLYVAFNYTRNFSLQSISFSCSDLWFFFCLCIVMIRYLLGFLYPISRLISYSVFEKVGYQMARTSEIFSILKYFLNCSWCRT